MKRTEAIRHLKEALMVDESVAASVLDLVEAMGMKPPCLDNDKCQVLMQVYYDADLNMWDEWFDSKPELVEKLERRIARKRK